MKTFLIVLSVAIVVIIVLWCLFVKCKDKKATQMVREINPFHSLSTNSFIGFQLHDNWEFVLSRMHHLGLISLRDLGEQKMAYMERYKDTFTFKTTINILKNIDHVTFEIDVVSGKLFCIEITLKADKGQEMADLKRYLYDIYSKVCGKPIEKADGYVFKEEDGSYITIGTNSDILTIGMPRINCIFAWTQDVFHNL